MIKYFSILFFCAGLMADTIPVSTLIHFETGSQGDIISTTSLNNGSAGYKGSAWETYTDPGANTTGTLTIVKTDTNASFQLYTPASVLSTYNDASPNTRGMRVTLSTEQAVGMTFPGTGYQLSVGFYLRFNGPQIDFSPRDVVALRSDPTGNYQFLQLYDGSDPHFHAHWQPGGTGIGNDVSISRGHWYWFTMKHVAGGGTFTVSCYDAEGGYSLVGTSTGSVSSGTSGCTRIQFGNIKYGTSASQSLDFDNFVISTNGVFPLGPGGGPLLIPASRVVTWNTNYCGVSNGIPSAGWTIYTNMTGIDATGASDVSSAIQNALDNCPWQQVVKLPAGTFKITTSSLSITDNGVVLRGAGRGQTILVGDETSTSAGNIKIESGNLTGVTNAISLRSGYTKGSSNIVLNATDSNLKVGYIVLLDQLNDGVMFVNDDGIVGGSTRLDISRSNGTRVRSQAVQITAISASTNLTVWPPLVYDLDATKTPELYYRRSNSTTNNYVRFSGIESLTVTNTSNTGSKNFYLNRSENCWVYDCESRDAATYHIQVLNSYRPSIAHNTCNGTRDATSSNGYGIDFDYQTCSGVIEDNVIANNRDFIKVSSGGVGNAVLYNYHTNAVANSDAPAFFVHTGGSHSAHPMMDLWEGNITYKLVYDFYWGSGSHQTLLRNWVRGPKGLTYASQSGATLVIDTTNSYFNVVGNILGYPSMTSNGEWSGYASTKISTQSYNYDTQYATYRIGYFSDGDTGSTGNNGTNQWSTHYIGGNYDYVSGAVAWYAPTNAETVPSSYYYSAAPAYFTNTAGVALTWPPIDTASLTYSISETNLPAANRFFFESQGGGTTGGGATFSSISSGRTVRGGNTIRR